MRLSEVVNRISGAQVVGGDADFDSVVLDSRRANPGSLFVAIRGLKSDGHDFLGDAISRGAAAVVVQADGAHLLTASSPPALVVPDSRAALAQVAAAIYRDPARELRMIGVTGTDGKTTLCHLIEHILTASAERTGLVTTAECRIGDRDLTDTGRFTTPEAPELQAMLREMADAECRWAVVEATSHGLALHRLDACEFDIAAATAITSDHLEFHGTVEEYVAAKSRLFSMLDEATDKGVNKTAVLNADDPRTSRLRKASHAATVTYGITNQADIRARDIRAETWSTQFKLDTPAGASEVALNYPGTFMLGAALAATAVGLTAGLDLDQVTRGISSWTGAPGRMEIVDEGQPFKVVVDFAHAPQSLERVLEVLRSATRGRVFVVFGCIGERERDRRRAMGEVAARAADYTIVTDDNPYTEDRDVIIREIVGGLEASGRRRGHDFEVIPDRREAIAQAIGMAVDEDVVLLAGKGHESEIHLGETSYACDDRLVAAAELRRLVGSTAS
jgi:UDP-N-acetylmuramoyl-L-alanyl-D-glutamate--2,6-diaminopimelate ligase